MPIAKRSDTNSAVPYWKSECGHAAVYVGDCKDVIQSMDKEQFHAVVTDPPYGLEFMGKAWDAPWRTQIQSKYKYYGSSESYLFQLWFMERAELFLNVALPGAHLLSFGGTRMWHRVACAIEDAGYEMRDTILWVYGSGYPKGYDVAGAIDDTLGFASKGNPVTDAAQKWAGWNTTLKPAVEPIVLARKPLHGTVAANVMQYGCGGLNIDACRVGTTGAVIQKHVVSKTSSGSGIYQFNNGDAGAVSMEGGYIKEQIDGKWPANLIHDGSTEVIDCFPDEASKLFYCAKADDADRPHGTGRGATIHPTVKPLDLMVYLVRLVCAAGGNVLDPFMGSGSTGCAAIQEGMWFTGIEQSQEYADIAIGKIRLALERTPAGNRLEYKANTPSSDASHPPVRRLRGAK